MTRFVCLEFGHTLRGCDRQGETILKFTNLDPVEIFLTVSAGLRRPITAYNPSINPYLSSPRKSHVISLLIWGVYEKAEHLGWIQ